jgi:hypothetical protein
MRTRELSEGVSNVLGPALENTQVWDGVQRALRDIGQLSSDLPIPNFVNSASGVVEALTNTGASLKQFYTNGDDLKPLMDAVVATGKTKLSDAVTSFASWATNQAELDAADAAAKIWDRVGGYFNSAASNASDVVLDTIEEAGGVKECDGEIAREKLNILRLYLAALSPGSAIVPDDNLAVTPGALWDASRSDGAGYFCDPELTIGSTPQNTGSVAVTNGNYIITNPGTLTAPTTLGAGISNGSITVQRLGTSTMAKTTSYDWFIDMDMELTFQATAGTLGTQLGASGSMEIWWYSGDAAVGLTAQQRIIVTYDPAGTVIKVNIPAYRNYLADPAVFDFAIGVSCGTGTAATMTMTLKSVGYNLYAQIKSTIVPRTDVTYDLATGSGNITNTEQWLAFIGKLTDWTKGRDPNLSVDGLWLKRTDVYTHVFRSFIAYLENFTCAKIKYERAYNLGGCGITSFETVADIGSWIYASGPLGGKAQDNISRFLNFLWNDLNSLENAMDFSALVNSEFAKDNGFCS